MKHLFRLPLLLLLLTCSALLLSCDDDDDPFKVHVKVRVTGENLAGLGAEMTYATVRNTLTNPHPGPSGGDTYAVRADSTYELGEYGAYDALEVTLIMRNVTCANAATRLGPNSWLKAEIIAGNKVLREVVLNQASARTLSCSTTPYLALAVLAGGTGGKWDD